MNATADSPGCGRSIETLASYLDTGSSSDAVHISSCPQCQAGLGALKQLNKITRELLDHDLATAEAPGQPWLQEILNNLRLETRPGRNVPIRPGHPGDELSQTEGSVIALVRNVGDTIHGATIGRCRLHGDLTTPGEPVDLEIRVSALYGYPLAAMTGRLRSRVDAALATHTELNLRSINITVSDLIKATGQEERAT